MELIIDNSKHVENDFRFATAVDPNKCLKKIKLPISLYKCARMSWLPSNISTMIFTDIYLREQN